MVWMRTPTRRATTITPDEASAIADRLLQISREGEALAVDLDRLRVRLNDMWQGRAKERFMDGFNHRPGAARSEAGFAAEQANRIASMKVTIWETVWEWTRAPE